MSYYNPEIYNYESLSEADRPIIDGYDTAVEEFETVESLVIDRVCTEYEDEQTVIGKAKREVISATLESVRDFLDIHRTELIVSLMEASEE